MDQVWEPMETLEAYFAGEIEAGDAKRLRDWIAEHPDQFSDIAARARVHSYLSMTGVRNTTENFMKQVLARDSSTSVAAEGSVESGSRPRPATTKRRTSTKFFWLTGAGLAACALVAIAIEFTSRTATAGTVARADDVEWISEPLAEGDAVRKGEIHIESGKLEVKLASEAEVKLDGAVKLDVVDAAVVRVRRGTVEFHCPEAAKGFKVSLPGGAEVIDLGTDFLVEVGDDDMSNVIVKQGRVEVRAPGESPITLTTGDQVAVRSKGEQRIGQVAKLGRTSRWQKRFDKLARGKNTFLALPFDGDGVALRPDEKAPIDGTATPAMDRFGKEAGALHFDGTTSLKYALGWPSNLYTLSLWVRADEMKGGEYLVAVEADDGELASRRVRLLKNAVKADAFVRGMHRFGEQHARGMGGSGRLATDRWTHVVVTFRRIDEGHAYLAVYIDGERTSENTFVYREGDDPIADGLTVGASPLDLKSGRHFVGDLDDLLLFSRFMDDKQVRELYEDSRPAEHPPAEFKKTRKKDRSR